MICPVLTPLTKNLPETLSYSFGLDEDWIETTQGRVANDTPSLDTQRLRAFYCIDFMVGTISIGYAGYRQNKSPLEDAINVDLEIPIPKSKEGLQSVLNDCEKKRRSVVVFKGTQSLLGSSTDFHTGVVTDSTMSRISDIEGAVKLLQYSLTSTNLSPRFGIHVLTYLNTLRSPDMTKRLIENLLLISPTNAESPVQWLKKIVPWRLSSSR